MLLFFKSYGDIKSYFSVQISKNQTYLALKVLLCIKKSVLAIIYSNSLLNCMVHQLKIKLFLIVKIFKSISAVQSQTVGATLGWPQFTKQHYSHKNVDGFMVLNLGTSSDDALYLYQVS